MQTYKVGERSESIEGGLGREVEAYRSMLVSISSLDVTALTNLKLRTHKQLANKMERIGLDFPIQTV